MLFRSCAARCLRAGDVGAAVGDVDEQGSLLRAAIRQSDNRGLDDAEVQTLFNAGLQQFGQELVRALLVEPHYGSARAFDKCMAGSKDAGN
jgi:hypothetical protein